LTIRATIPATMVATRRLFSTIANNFTRWLWVPLPLAIGDRARSASKPPEIAPRVHTSLCRAKLLSD
jgi:hypothetical protein